MHVALITGLETMTNQFLDHLSQADRRYLEPYLKTVDVTKRTVLFEVGQRVDRVYFPISAVISLLVTLSSGTAVEFGTVGFDGIVGAAAAMDDGVPLSRAIVQLPGTVIECDAQLFKAAVLESPRMLNLIFRHERGISMQAQQGVACHAGHTVQARLCRWLLRARDLTDSNKLVVTQADLAQTLGVRRTSITEAAQELQQSGIIRYSRGNLAILNAAALRGRCCECYRVVANHYQRLTDPRSRRMN